MKSRLNLIVLTAEIAAIAMLHVIKLNYSDKNNTVISSRNVTSQPDFHAGKFYTLSNLKQ
jgi:hypothetical protein